MAYNLRSHRPIKDPRISYNLRPRRAINYAETSDSDLNSEEDGSRVNSHRKKSSARRVETKKQADLYAQLRRGRCLGFTRANSGNLRWVCSSGHRWYAPLGLMREEHRWCPHCPLIRERTCRYILEDLTGKSFPPARPPFLGGLHLDGYCEELSLAFEYNGEQHYKFVPFFHEQGRDDLRRQKKRDQKKLRLCESEGIALVCIPFYINDLVSFIKDELDSRGYLTVNRRK